LRGGAYNATLANCILTGNVAGWGGGGAIDCIMYNCLLSSNTISGAGGGGGSYRGSLYNCTVVGNSQTGAGGGAVYDCAAVYNCIIYFNSGTDQNWKNVNASGFKNSCTTPAAAGWAAGNITGDPRLINSAGGNYRLATGSPCINTGTNGTWTTTYPYDIDFRQRIRYGTVDMGAHENIRAGTIYGFR